MTHESKSISLGGAFFIFAMLFSFVGCATYQNKVAEIRDGLEQNPKSSLSKLKALANEEGRDQLVYLLDYATALQIAGEFKDSAAQFIRADRLADAKDYLSVSKFAASLLFSQELTPYRGDDFELMMINAMNALNFLALNDHNGALVETRRINEKLKWISQRTNKPFKKNPFASYLAALIWEADKKYDDAFIDYKEAFRLDPNIPFIKEDLVRSSYKAQRIKEYKEYSQSFGIDMKPEWNPKNHGSVVVIHLAGWGARKRPRFEDSRFPALYTVWTKAGSSQLIINNEKKISSQKIYSVDEAAIKTLEDEYGELVAKRLAGIAAKEIVTHQVRQNDETAAAILNIVMHASDRADLRQWSTLPSTINLIRWDAPVGKYSLQLQSSEESSQQTTPQEIDIKVGKTSFIVWRTL